MNIYIIWGFLGSEEVETTLINYLLSSYLSEERWLSLVRSGTESVDSVLLRSKLSSKDLNSGCICYAFVQELPIAIKK